MDLANWALQTSLKFTTGVKYQFHRVFDQIKDPNIPITLCPLKELELLCESYQEQGKKLSVLTCTKKRKRGRKSPPGF